MHDALTASNLGPLAYLFDEETLSSLPQTGSHRVRWTMLTLIGLLLFLHLRVYPEHPPGEYATYFSSNGSTSALLRAVSYTVNALPEPTLSLQASVTLRELCDANRSILAPHLNSFADLHRNIELLGSEEKSKVLESIASVISAMPPAAQIEPVLAIVQPLLASMEKCLSQQMVSLVYLFQSEWLIESSSLRKMHKCYVLVSFRASPGPQKASLLYLTHWKSYLFRIGALFLSQGMIIGY